MRNGIPVPLYFHECFIRRESSTPLDHMAALISSASLLINDYASGGHQKERNLNSAQLQGLAIEAITGLYRRSPVLRFHARLGELEKVRDKIAKVSYKPPGLSLSVDSLKDAIPHYVFDIQRHVFNEFTDHAPSQSSDTELVRFAGSQRGRKLIDEIITETSQNASFEGFRLTGSETTPEMFDVLNEVLGFGGNVTTRDLINNPEWKFDAEQRSSGIQVPITGIKGLSANIWTYYTPRAFNDAKANTEGRLFKEMSLHTYINASTNTRRDIALGVPTF